MDSNYDKLVNIVVCHGPKKNKIEILSSARLKELNKMIENLLSINKDGQKLIYKGKLLNDSESSISSYGIKDGDIVMALGKTVRHERDSHHLELDKITSSLKDTETKVLNIVLDLKSLVTNSSHHIKNLSHIKECLKKLLLANEDLMKLLEALDGLQIEINSEEVRSRRKGIVKDIQKLMEKIDKDYITFEAQLSVH